MSERSQVDAIRERDEPLLVQVLPLLEEGHYDVLADLLQA